MENEDIFKWADEHVYPLTILKDRYSGSYSGGLYIATDAYEIPEEIGSGDSEEMNFWYYDYPKFIKENPYAEYLAVGNSIETALVNLKIMIERRKKHGAAK